MVHVSRFIAPTSDEIRENYNLDFASEYNFFVIFKVLARI